MFLPNTLKNLGTSHMFSAGALGLEADESPNVFLGHLRCKVEVMYSQSLLGSGLLYTCTVSLCVLFVSFCSFSPAPVVRLVFPSLFCLP